MSTQRQSQTEGDTGENNNSLRATYAGAKRRIAQLEEQLKDLREAGTKPKSDVVSYVTQGRVISRLVSMFEPIRVLVDESDRRQRLSPIDNDDEDLQPIDHTPDQDRNFRGFNLLVQHISGFENKLLELEFSQLNTYFRDLQKGAGGARGDDAANLKSSVVSWVTALFDHPYTPLSPTNKFDRGFEHDSTGALLCPVDFDWNDLQVRQRIRDGHPDYVVSEDSWPAFLYPHATCDPEDVERGLFKSVILLKCFKFLFTSPTSAQDIETEQDLENSSFRPVKKGRKQRAPTRGHVADIIGLKTVTPRSIAYVCVQLRFALSSANVWNEMDGCFNYQNFYNNIVDFFELTPGPAAQKRTQELLAWWTSMVFRAHKMPTNADNRANTSVSKLVHQRAARELVTQGLLGLSGRR